MRRLLDAEEKTRWIAAFEFFKGLVVLFVGLGLLSFLDQDLQAAGENLVTRLHLNPAHRYPEIFISALGRMTDSRLWWLAAGAVIYAAIRFVEAYGLWRQRLWAEWFAVVSGSVYIPIELYEIWKDISLLKVLLLIVNSAIVVCLVQCIRRQKPEISGAAQSPPARAYQEAVK